MAEKEGWKCPVCGKGKAPWVTECVHAERLVPLPTAPNPYAPYPWVRPQPWTSPFTYKASDRTVKADSRNTLIFNSN